MFEFSFVTVLFNIKLIEIFKYFSLSFFSFSFKYYIISFFYYSRNDKNKSINNKSS